MFEGEKNGLEDYRLQQFRAGLMRRARHIHQDSSYCQLMHILQNRQLSRIFNRVYLLSQFFSQLLGIGPGIFVFFRQRDIQQDQGLKTGLNGRSIPVLGYE